MGDIIGMQCVFLKTRLFTAHCIKNIPLKRLKTKNAHAETRVSLLIIIALYKVFVKKTRKRALAAYIRAKPQGAARTCGKAAAERPTAAPARPQAGRPRRPLGLSS